MQPDVVETDRALPPAAMVARVRPHLAALGITGWFFGD